MSIETDRDAEFTMTLGELADSFLASEYADQFISLDRAVALFLSDPAGPVSGTWVDNDKFNALADLIAERRMTTLTRVAKPSMEVNISFRVKRELRDKAREVADERQENVSDILREALERYIKKGGK